MIVIIIHNVIFSPIFHFYWFSNISYISWWILLSNQKRINNQAGIVLMWIINPIDRNPTYNSVSTFRTTLVSQCNRNYTVQEQLENLYIHWLKSREIVVCVNQINVKILFNHIYNNKIFTIFINSLTLNWSVLSFKKKGGKRPIIDRFFDYY